MDTQSTFHKLTVTIISVFLLLAAGIVGNRIITGGAAVVTLPSAPLLLGQATQPLLATSLPGARPTVSGYTIRNVRYFDSNTWAIAQLVPPKNGGDITTVAMQMVGPFYQTILGPGTSFSSNATTGLPTDVTQYLNSRGQVYNAN